MRIVFFGTPEFALPTLEALVASDHQVLAVVSRPDKPVGRKKILTAPPVAEAARRLGIPVMQPKSLKNTAFVNEVEEYAPDCCVVVAFGKLIPGALLDVPPAGMVNLHPSLLPRHRGPSPIQWALVCGDRVTGVTTMLLDEGMDTGPILLQERVPINETETADELGPRLAEKGAALIVRSLDGLEDGSVRLRPQPEEGVSVTPMLQRSFGKIEWSNPARQLVNRLRGFTPWPGLHTTFRGGRIKVFGLQEVDPAPAGDEEPGTVLAADQEGILTRCGRGSAVRITDLQRDGRRRMPADAFLIGERVSPGEHFG